MVIVQAESFDAGAKINAFMQGRTDAGACVSFTGVVRDETQSARVAELALDHYPGFTEAALEKLVARARTQWSVGDILLIHRVGPMRPGDTIVLVAVAATHRDEAFEAARFLVDALKTDAPIWKKETAPDGSVRWIEPPAELSAQG